MNKRLLNTLLYLATIGWVLGAWSLLQGQPLHVIDEANAQQVMAQGQAAGHGTGWIADSKFRCKSSFSSQYPTIPRSQWPALVKAGQGTFLSDMIKAGQIPVKNQDGLGYCWVYASVEAVEVMRLMQGQPYVDLSPESVGGPINGWRNQGGNGIDALNQLSSVGCCATSFMDRANSLRHNNWKSGWEEDCTHHKVNVAWSSVDTFDEVYTALLMRMPVSIGLNWWGHQVMLTDPIVFPDGSFGVMFRNSWGNDWPQQGAGGWSTLTERKSQPSGSFAAVGVGLADIRPGEKVTPASLVAKRQELVRRIMLKQVKVKSILPPVCGPVHGSKT